MTHLTAAGLDAMVAYGIHTVIDLRTAAELKGEGSRAPGITYRHLPLVEEVKTTVDQAPPGVGRYIRIVDARQAAFGQVFTAIAEAGGPVLFHCFAGKDRTGLVAALLLELAGVSREHIAADYGETDVQLSKQYAIWLSEAPPDRLEEIRADLSCSADRILGVLDHIDSNWGGVANYLEAAGVSAANVELLSTKLS